MNEIGNEPQSRPAGNEDQIENLRSQMNLMFGALIIVSFTLTAFLGLQGRRASKDLVEAQSAAEQSFKMIQQEESAAGATIQKLKEFARTHPDFDKQQILSLFRVNTNAAPAAPAKK